MINYRIERPRLKLWIVGPWIQHLQAFVDLRVSRSLRNELLRLFQAIFQRYPANSFPLFVECLAKRFPADRLDQEFHTGLHAGFALTIAVEKPQGSSGEIEQLVRRKKMRVEICQVRRGPKAPA